jgi:hypothetical protein
MENASSFTSVVSGSRRDSDELPAFCSTALGTGGSHWRMRSAKEPPRIRAVAYYFQSIEDLFVFTVGQQRQAIRERATEHDIEIVREFSQVGYSQVRHCELDEMLCQWSPQGNEILCVLSLRMRRRREERVGHVSSANLVEPLEKLMVFEWFCDLTKKVRKVFALVLGLALIVAGVWKRTSTQIAGSRDVAPWHRERDWAIERRYRVT